MKAEALLVGSGRSGSVECVVRLRLGHAHTVTARFVRSVGGSMKGRSAQSDGPMRGVTSVARQLKRPRSARAARWWCVSIAIMSSRNVGEFRRRGGDARCAPAPGAVVSGARFDFARRIRSMSALLEGWLRTALRSRPVLKDKGQLDRSRRRGRNDPRRELGQAVVTPDAPRTRVVAFGWLSSRRRSKESRPSSQNVTRGSRPSVRIWQNELRTRRQARRRVRGPGV